MTPANIGAPSNFTLDELNQLVTQNEGLLGPLTSMGNDTTQSILTFDQDQPLPGKNAVIAPLQSGNPVVPANSTLVVASATIFISGTLTASSASRPN
jgi:hypothetical protein